MPYSTAAFVLFRVPELGILLHVFMLIALGDNALLAVYHIDSATARALHLLTHHVVDALDGRSVGSDAVDARWIYDIDGIRSRH